MKMLEFKYNHRIMTVEEIDESVYIEMEDSEGWDNPFWLDTKQSRELFFWLADKLGIDFE